MKTYPSFHTFSIALAIYYLTIVVFLSAKSKAHYRVHYCPNTTFTPNSRYESNLKVLLSSLSSNTTQLNGSYYNTTVGQSRDTIYGSFLCRGDLVPRDCLGCVATAARELNDTYCPNGIKAIVWYDDCMLQYSNTSFFGTMTQSPLFYLWNRNNISDPEGTFNGLVGDTMREAVSAASSERDRFATREANFSAFQSLYSLAQCTPDISSIDCGICLSSAVSQLPTCCAGKQGGRVLSPSCYVRFETYLFYTNTKPAVVPSPAPENLPSAPPQPSVESRGSNDNAWTRRTVIIAVSVPIVILSLAILVGFCYWRKRGGLVSYNAIRSDQNGDGEITATEESLRYDLARLQAATNNFSDENKIGEGGFGTVFKGVLSDGKEIAVKRLLRSSLEGVNEFKNEVLLVAKLQHRNLARLFGFCLEEEEKILVYEFVRNKSLDYFLFDESSDSSPLDWSRRFKIIGGIARGILYLHEDSRLRIIHRDLKVSNILLDEQMNAKISDFGTAKLFGVDETHGSTNRIVGTYGYMSPEYAFYGQFSVKSDVYSFGVLIIEIITGKKCSRFYDSDISAEDLFSFTWKNWRNGTALDLVDPRIGDSYTANEVTRCIHIGLLCIQEDPADRPSMATIVVMLSSFSISLPLPKQPAFFPRSRPIDTVPQIQSSAEKSQSDLSSFNEMSLSETYPR